METDSPSLDRATVAFALSAAIAILFNTVASCAKDASASLKAFMATGTGSDWLNQGFADVVLFLVLGLILMNTRLAETMSAKRVISLLVAMVLISGVGLFVWYALY